MKVGEARMNIEEASLNESERRTYRAASDMLAEGTDAPTFSARFFGPQGELNRVGQSHEDRERTMKSALYQWLKAKYAELRLRDAAHFERDLKLAAGRLTVVVPRSLHAALKDEAASEGVSLSELIRLKLAVPYRQMTDLLIPRSKSIS
jgi:predicted HicB family RNase H-like nuclease